MAAVKNNPPGSDGGTIFLAQLTLKHFTDTGPLDLVFHQAVDFKRAEFS